MKIKILLIGARAVATDITGVVSELASAEPQRIPDFPLVLKKCNFFLKSS